MFARGPMCSIRTHTLIPKHEPRFKGFGDQAIALYARGMTVREIQGVLTAQYGTEVSPEFISSVAGAVLVKVGAWQSRPLEPICPVVFFDVLRANIHEDAVVRTKTIYLALGVLPDETREILGICIENTEGAKFRLKAFNDLKTRRAGNSRSWSPMASRPFQRPREGDFRPLPCRRASCH